MLVSPTNEQEQEQVATLAAAVQVATGQHVEAGFVDEGCTRPTAGATV